MTIGRIGGPMLKENLVRQGVDLSIETDLTYFDVNNSRVGINIATPAVDLDVNGTARITSALQFSDADRSNWVAFQAPSTVTSNVTWTLPATDGSSGNALLTHGDGSLYWGTVSGGGSTSTTVATTPPVSPSTGDLWWNSEEGQLKVYYDDGDTAQWVDATISTGAQGPVGYTGSAGSGGGASVSISDIAPATPTSGDIWWDNEEGQLKIYYDDGTSSQWIDASKSSQGFTGSFGYTGSVGYTGSAGSVGYVGSAGSNGEITFISPTTSTFATVRADTGTFENLSENRGVRLRFTTPGNTNNHLYALNTITSGAGGWQAITRVRQHSWAINYMKSGISIRDSVSGKSQLLGLGDAYTFANIWFSNDTTYVNGTSYTGISDHNIWLKLMEDGTNRKFYYSLDGDFWQLLFTATIASQYVTAPTHVGIGMNPAYTGIGASKEIATDWLSWQQTAL